MAVGFRWRFRQRRSPGWDLYATANGELFCLDPATGDIRWQNPLKGLGRGYITIAASGNQQAIVMRDKRRRDDEAAPAASSAT